MLTWKKKEAPNSQTQSQLAISQSHSLSLIHLSAARGYRDAVPRRHSPPRQHNLICPLSNQPTTAAVQHHYSLNRRQPHQNSPLQQLTPNDSLSVSSRQQTQRISDLLHHFLHWTVRRGKPCPHFRNTKCWRWKHVEFE